MFKIVKERRRIINYKELLDKHLKDKNFVYYLSPNMDDGGIYQFFKRGDSSPIGRGNTPEEAFKDYLESNNIIL